MATKDNSTNANKTTQAHEFYWFPENETKLLSVNEGVNCTFALRTADGLDSAVKVLLEEAIDNPMHGDVAFLCRFAMHCAEGIRMSADIYK